MPYVKDIIKTGSGAQLGQPKKIGQYIQELDVHTNRRTISLDSDEPLYFHQPEEGVEFDLLAGFKPEVVWGKDRDTTTGVYQDKEDRSRYEPASLIFHWILANPDSLADSDGSPIDFIATRSKLTNLLLIPSPNSHNDWPILASKFRETIFLKITYNEWAASDPDLNNKLSYSGTQFQQYLLSSEEDQAPSPVLGKQDLTKLKSYKGIIQSSVGNRRHSHSFIVPRDLDGVVPHLECPEESLDRFVEIRTVSAHKKTRPNFERFDLQKWWAAAHLVGVPKIFCGYRNENFKVVETETFVTDDLPIRCGNFWSKNKCISFFDGFLSLVKTRVIENNPRVVYEFKYNPVNRSIESQRLNATPQLQVVPEWFIKEFEALG